jgi:hypothetical protein
MRGPNPLGWFRVNENLSPTVRFADGHLPFAQAPMLVIRRQLFVE